MENTQVQNTLAQNALEVRNLHKTYPARGNQKSKHALKGVDIAVPRGSIFGLLGPNGAGKSTLINILAGLAIKDCGHVNIWGFDLDVNPRNVRMSIGIVPQEVYLDPFFTPRQALELQSGLFGIPARLRKTEELLKIMALTEQGDTSARALSGGMRRRLLAAKAMVHSPPILVLDEPTAGVDIELRQQLWSHIRDLNQHGVTILLTTHYLEEAEEMCDRIAIIDGGEVLVSQNKEDLLSRIDHKQIIIWPAKPLATLPPKLAKPSPGATGHIRENDGAIVISYRKSQSLLAKILADIHEAGIEISDLSTKEPDLEDVFVALTQAHKSG